MDEIEKVMQSAINKSGEHAGHRKRIIKKLEQGVLLEHELLEVLLFNAIPRKNTNDIAHRLLAEFKSLRGVFQAKMSDLQKVDGVGESVASYIACIGVIFREMYTFFQTEIPKKFEAKSFTSFVKKEYGKEKVEVLDFYLVDVDGKIFHRQRFERDDFSKVNVQPEDFTRMLIEKKPVGIVAVHNHPYANCTPSQKDEETTAQFQMICSFHNVALCDHFICGQDGVYSYYLDGKMQEISKKYSIKALTSNV